MLLRDLFLNNFRRKLFALMLAILVWMTIHFAEVRKQNVPTPPPPSTNPPALNP